MRCIYFSVLIVILLAGCGPFVTVQNVSDVPKARMQEAYKIKTFTVDSDKTTPSISEYLGNITAYSCKNMMWDPPASKGDALIQLRLKALELGADGIMDITFDSRGTDTLGTNCWESVQVNGMAVKFGK